MEEEKIQYEIYIILMLMSTSIIFAETKFEDLNKEHWHINQ